MTLPKAMAAPPQSELQLLAAPGPSTSSTGTSLPSFQQPVKQFAWMPPKFTHLGKFRKTVSFTTSELVPIDKFTVIFLFYHLIFLIFLTLMYSNVIMTESLLAST